MTQVAYHPKRGLTLRPRRIPLNRILCLVALFWGSNVTNNLAFAYNISIPLHTMFRSLSLASSMLLVWRGVLHAFWRVSALRQTT